MALGLKLSSFLELHPFLMATFCLLVGENGTGGEDLRSCELTGEMKDIASREGINSLLWSEITASPYCMLAFPTPLDS